MFIKLIGYRQKQRTKWEKMYRIYDTAKKASLVKVEEGGNDGKERKFMEIL